ncbi:catenin alpha-like [Paramacrobiotus metropolitanus]|uniref:catenin alpha-like n=1 Tax=Paramacrobiotus metropolitanus TaxID=2943436 RepID=UPI0024463988|nr:catenin alpha-like [Paramacrobiotus metropolitanus]
MSATAASVFKWDPKSLEIRTRTVEKTLEPLVIQVTTLVNAKGSPSHHPGRSKRGPVLVATVERATSDFIAKGEQIARDNVEMKQELTAAVDDVRKSGEVMSVASREFVTDPCSSIKRANMVRAARSLLSAVTRLLILADEVDVRKLLKSLRIVEANLERFRNATSQQEIVEHYKAFDLNVADLTQKAALRQKELMDAGMRDDLASARAVLKKNSVMLLTASKAYVRHPELPEARSNRDFVLDQVVDAVGTIGEVAQGRRKERTVQFEGPGELAAALDEFDERVIMDPIMYNEVRSRPMLEAQLESIIRRAAEMADSSCTRDDRRERIVAECNAVRQALQDLLTQYMDNMGRSTQTEGLEYAMEHLTRKTRDLRRQLRKAVVDHVSDSFLETNVPLLVLIEAAKAGDEVEVKEYSQVFHEHAYKLVEVAHLACRMSNQEEGVRMVRYAASQIEALCPQVVNAARILSQRPKSKIAQENMDAFKQSWESQVRVLTEAVDDITTIDDFLAVSESHILEDVNKCVLALQERDADTLDRTAGAIRGRTARVCNVVEAEMENYEPGIYTKRVIESTGILRDHVILNFAQRVHVAVDAFNSGNHVAVNDNDFIEAARMVYEGIRQVRKTVLMGRSAEEIESESDWEEEEIYDTRHKGPGEDVADLSSARAQMTQLPEADKQKIAAQVEIFKIEKSKFDKEVAKWDDTGNDIIVLAKHMCMIMMEMTDFTRGKGPLKTTMDVINAAKKISEAGTKLDKLARQIADQCPESSTKKDLLAYLQRIALYCHQLNITTKVKADVQNISGEMVISGLDSATSLIQAAKNLMNAVVLTVKSSFVASTKYTSKMGGKIHSPIIVWRMRAPDKKPLVKREKPEESKAKVRRGSQKKTVAPIKALSEFQSPADAV